MGEIVTRGAHVFPAISMIRLPPGRHFSPVDGFAPETLDTSTRMGSSF